MGIAEKTILNYEESIKRFLEVLEYDDLKITELEKDNILSFIQILQEKELRTEVQHNQLINLRCQLSQY